MTLSGNNARWEKVDVALRHACHNLCCILTVCGSGVSTDAARAKQRVGVPRMHCERSSLRRRMPTTCVDVSGHYVAMSRYVGSANSLLLPNPIASVL